MRAFALTVLLGLICVPVWAQSAPALLYVSDARYWDPTNAAQQIDYALPMAEAVPASITSRIDNGAWVSAVPSCDLSGSNGVRWCHLMTPELRTALNVPGLHRVEIANGLNTSPALLLRTPDQPLATCPYVTPTGTADPKPVGYRMGATKVIGSRTADADVDAFAKRIGQLEAWGFQVKWASLSSSLLAMTARCIGPAQ